MKKVLCVMVMISLFRTASCQYYFESSKYYSGNLSTEFGLSAGFMNCFTDIGGQKGTGNNFIKDINWTFSKPAAGIYSSATFKNFIAIRFQLTLGSVTAHDSILKNIRSSTHGRYERNLGFRSRITDLQLATEFHPRFLIAYEDEPPFLSPYIIGGIGFFFFDPQAKMDGIWHRLQPLRTEGQGFPEFPGRTVYKLCQLNFPIGIGLRYELGPFTYLRMEVVHRVLTTDYLDDVSNTYIDKKLFFDHHEPQVADIAWRLSNRSLPYNGGIPQAGDHRGNAGKNDSYFSAEIKLGLTLKRRIHSN